MSNVNINCNVGDSVTVNCVYGPSTSGPRHARRVVRPDMAIRWVRLWKRGWTFTEIAADSGHTVGTVGYNVYKHALTLCINEKAKLEEQLAAVKRG